MEKTYSFQKLAQYVWDFCLELGLLQSQAQVAIGFSGGKDSRLLLELSAHWLRAGKLQAVRVLHFNHGLRAASASEEVFCAEVCRHLGLPFVLGRSITPAVSEAALRKARFHFFYQELKPGEQLLLAHHLDDSLEWSLRQFARTSELKSILGMPAKNGPIRRPLMCLSRAQIDHACTQFGLEFRHDESNFNEKYERNFIRQRIIPPFKKLSQSALKNYVARSEALASRLGLSLRQQNQGLEVVVSTLPYTSIIWRAHHPPGEEARELMAQILKDYSSKERGMWRDQIGKLLLAQKKGWAGPLSFSGGVGALVTPGRVTFYPLEGGEKLKRILRFTQLPQTESRYPFNSLKYWLFTYCVIDFNDYPVVNRQHILSQWAQLPPGFGLITKEQILALPEQKQRLFKAIPLV